MLQFLCLAFVSVVFSGGQESHVCAISDREAVEASAERLQKGFPWYDAANEEVAPVNVRHTKPLKSRDAWEWNRRQSRRKWNWNWPDLGRVLQACVWIGLALVIGALLYFFVRSFMLAGGSRSEAVDTVEDVIGDAQRMENLPFPVRKQTTDLLGEAVRNYEAGNFSEAIIYLFSYQLVQLDKNNLIRLTKGKTNRQYVHEIRKRMGLRQLLAATMFVFEDVFFGHHPLDRGRFEACWNRLDDFHRLLEQTTR